MGVANLFTGFAHYLLEFYRATTIWFQLHHYYIFYDDLTTIFDDLYTTERLSVSV